MTPENKFLSGQEAQIWEGPFNRLADAGLRLEGGRVVLDVEKVICRRNGQDITLADFISNQAQKS